MSVRKGLWADGRGTAATELAIMLPCLLALGLGAFEFGGALYSHHVISTGLRDAARYLSRVPDPAEAILQANARAIAVYGEAGGATRRLSWWTTQDVSIAVRDIANPADPVTQTRQYRGPDPIHIVRVSTSTSYPGLGFVSAIGLSPRLAINVYHEERVVGD